MKSSIFTYCNLLEFFTGGGGLHTLSAADDPATVRGQFQGLLEEFNKEECALIFHLTNHYALVYAIREISVAGVTRREMLTARWGQRPSVWLDWEEARSIMLKWGGYNILRVTLKQK